MPMPMAFLPTLAQLPLLAAYTLFPDWALPIGIAEGSLLYLYADCYPSATPLLAGLTLLRTLALLALTGEGMLMLLGPAVGGLAVGLFVGACVGGGERDGEKCLGCLEQRWWDRDDGPAMPAGAEGRAGGDARDTGKGRAREREQEGWGWGWGWGEWSAWPWGWEWEWDELDEEVDVDVDDFHEGRGGRGDRGGRERERDWEGREEPWWAREEPF
ncbi:hypothetical protein CALCODRAFT_479506 [Calocera cornea HHB12733]|uniref:Uncharacterized protein n=1 Tax=Calocera cornea HHB12733 TaxID=1353952 RepID=A0A165JM75_9BASI|nr:hypothetical protein CALCODRAFT_479506 [Calocera cornea HHB12733]